MYSIQQFMDSFYNMSTIRHLLIWKTISQMYYCLDPYHQFLDVLINMPQTSSIRECANTLYLGLITPFPLV